MRAPSLPFSGRLWSALLALVGPRTVTVVLALLMLAVGCALVYPPLGLIVPGALLFWLAVWPLVAPPRER